MVSKRPSMVSKRISKPKREGTGWREQHLENALAAELRTRGLIVVQQPTVHATIVLSTGFEIQVGTLRPDLLVPQPVPPLRELTAPLGTGPPTLCLLAGDREPSRPTMPFTLGAAPVSADATPGPEASYTPKAATISPAPAPATSTLVVLGNVSRWILSYGEGVPANPSATEASCRSSRSVALVDTAAARTAPSTAPETRGLACSARSRSTRPVRRPSFVRLLGRLVRLNYS